MQAGVDDSPGATLEEPSLIAILGPTGAGKTSFVNLVSGSDLLVGHGLTSGTDTLQRGNEFDLQGRSVVLIDTPGFDDSNGKDAKIFREITSFLAKSYTAGTKLAGVIYMHRISDVRMTGTAAQNFRLAFAMCGAANVVIVTTFWSGKEGAENEDISRERQLADDHFKLALNRGAKMRRYDRTKESGHEIIRDILENRPVPLTVQTQVIDQRIPLKDTTVGRELFNHFYSQLDSQETKLKKLQTDLQGLHVTEEERKHEIMEQTRNLEQNIAELRKDTKAMADKFDEQDKIIQDYANQARFGKPGKRRRFWKNWFGLRG